MPLGSLFVQDLVDTHGGDVRSRFGELFLVVGEDLGDLSEERGVGDGGKLALGGVDLFQEEPIVVDKAMLVDITESLELPIL